jgi:hypothetical protein
MPFDWLLSVMPTTYLYFFILRPIFQEHNYGVEQELGVYEI